MTQIGSEIISLTLHARNGDIAVLTFNDTGQPTLCRTSWDIAPFMPQLRRDWTAPEGCEWEKTGLLTAQVIRRN